MSGVQQSIPKQGKMLFTPNSILLQPQNYLILSLNKVNTVKIVKCVLTV